MTKEENTKQLLVAIEALASLDVTNKLVVVDKLLEAFGFVFEKAQLPYHTISSRTHDLDCTIPVIDSGIPSVQLDQFIDWYESRLSKYKKTPRCLTFEMYTDFISKLNKLDIDIDQLIEERTRTEIWADKLAQKISEVSGIDIGEHSSANSPWVNAAEAADEYIQNRTKMLDIAGVPRAWIYRTDYGVTDISICRDSADGYLYHPLYFKDVVGIELEDTPVGYYAYQNEITYLIRNLERSFDIQYRHIVDWYSLHMEKNQHKVFLKHH